MEVDLDTQQPNDEKFVLTSSRHFPQWLASTGCSIAFTTYQAGKVFLLGVGTNGQLSVFERTFARSIGLGVGNDGRTLALATQYGVQRFDNILPPGQVTSDGYDAIFAIGFFLSALFSGVAVGVIMFFLSRPKANEWFGWR